MPARQKLKIAGVVFVVALALRVLWAAFAQVTPISDFASYEALARQWLATGEFRDGLGLAYRTPGYPALLAGVFGLCDASLQAVALVQAVLGALTAALVALLALTVVSPRTSLIAGLLQALSPTAIIYVPILASENLATFLTLITIACLAGWQARTAVGLRSILWLLGGGTAAGLTLLTRPGDRKSVV